MRLRGEAMGEEFYGKGIDVRKCLIGYDYFLVQSFLGCLRSTLLLRPKTQFILPHKGK